METNKTTTTNDNSPIAHCIMGKTGGAHIIALGNKRETLAERATAIAARHSAKYPNIAKTLKTANIGGKGTLPACAFSARLAALSGLCVFEPSAFVRDSLNTYMTLRGWMDGMSDKDAKEAIAAYDSNIMVARIANTGKGKRDMAAAVKYCAENKTTPQAENKRECINDMRVSDFNAWFNAVHTAETEKYENNKAIADMFNAEKYAVKITA